MCDVVCGIVGVDIWMEERVQFGELVSLIGVIEFNFLGKDQSQGYRYETRTDSLLLRISTGISLVLHQQWRE